MIDARKRERALEAVRAFVSTPLDDLLAGGDSEGRALAVFRAAAADVPAYRAFLREHGVDARAVRSPDDFRRLPLTTKDGYVHRHPLAERCGGGRIDASDMLALSSGSTGRPTVWPRSLADELAVATRFEQVLHDSFEADRRTTLAVVCFPLGTWVGGMYTTACLRHVAGKGYPLTVVTPGNDLEEILRVVGRLGGAADQLVLLGYPPFVKGVVDAGRAGGVDWARRDVRLVLAGEVFSEEWRTLVGERTGSRRPCHDSASLYGTADAGVLGVETPLSVAVRRFLAGDPEAATTLFGSARLPTLVQYDPASRFLETHEGTLVVTAAGAAPLVRYHIADEGGLLAHDELLAFVRARGFDPPPGRPLPFAYVFGRSHFTVSYYGANVYPENVTVALERPPISDWTTGKFVLEARENEGRDRVLSLVVELAPGAEAGAEREREVAEAVVVALLRLNSEFAHYVPQERRLPQVRLAPAGDPEWFPRGVKHRYTRGPSGAGP